MRKHLLSLLFLISISVNAQTGPHVFLEKNAYSKRLANVFSLIADGKLQKAIKEREEIQEKYSNDKDLDKSSAASVEDYLFPLWQISSCLIMNTKEGIQNQKSPISIDYDPWRAYEILKQSTGEPKNKAIADEFFTLRKIGYTVTDIKAAIEANLVAMTENEGTEKAYDKLINVLYEYDDLIVVLEKREQIAFVFSMKTESEQDLQQYLNKYESFNPSHQRQITHRRDSLAFEMMEKNVSGCKQYLNRYPHSEYTDDVTKLLHKYEFDILLPSVEGCKEYLVKYPNSEYVGRVKTMMAQYAYDNAVNEGLPEALADYLREYSSSNKYDEAVKVLNDLLKRKFLYNEACLSELEYFVRHEEFSPYVDYNPYHTLYNNLMNLPTSAAMMDCKGLTGEVNYTTRTSSDNEYDETLRFNEQGLLTSQYNSRSGQNDSWEYDSNEKGEVCLVSKTDVKGKVTTYKTTFNVVGLVSTITGSDGTQISYGYDSNNTLKTITYSKGGQKTRIDHVDYNGQIVRSERSGITLTFEYDGKGSVVQMSKMRGNILMDQTTYEYEYGDSYDQWTSMRQYNNGSYFLSKRRSFNSPQTYIKPERKKRTNNAPVVISSSSPIESNNNDNVFDVVEQMPSFPGGQEGLMQWISNNMRYPTIAAENGIQGRVIVQFVVEKDGSITEVSVSKSVDPSLDKEAIRVVKSMPRWKAGTKDGSPVRVKYTTPVTFKLQ